MMVAVSSVPSGSGWECQVRVPLAGGESLHTVLVSPDELTRFGGEKATPEQVVARAFDFLLQREPPGEILRRFRLSDVERYFPEFEREMRRP